MSDPMSRHLATGSVTDQRLGGVCGRVQSGVFARLPPIAEGEINPRPAANETSHRPSLVEQTSRGKEWKLKICFQNLTTDLAGITVGEEEEDKNSPQNFPPTPFGCFPFSHFI